MLLRLELLERRRRLDASESELDLRRRCPLRRRRPGLEDPEPRRRRRRERRRPPEWRCPPSDPERERLLLPRFFFFFFLSSALLGCASGFPRMSWISARNFCISSGERDCSAAGGNPGPSRAARPPPPLPAAPDPAPLWPGPPPARGRSKGRWSSPGRGSNPPTAQSVGSCDTAAPATATRSSGTRLRRQGVGDALALDGQCDDLACGGPPLLAGVGGLADLIDGRAVDPCRSRAPSSK